MRPEKIFYGNGHRRNSYDDIRDKRFCMWEIGCLKDDVGESKEENKLYIGPIR